MPFYQLKCKKCGLEFEAFASIAERSASKIVCPDCGHTDLATVYGKGPAVHLHADSEPNPCPNAARCGGCCPHARRAK